MPLCGPEIEYGETIILYCVRAGYVAENASAFNYKCIGGQCSDPEACAFSKTACLTKGFVKSSTDNSCVSLSIELCKTTDYCY